MYVSVLKGKHNCAVEALENLYACNFVYIIRLEEHLVEQIPSRSAQ